MLGFVRYTGKPRFVVIVFPPVGASTATSAICRSSAIFTIRFCHSNASTLADNRQKRKPFLSVQYRFLSLEYQNLSFRIEGFQRVEPFPFLITKKPFLKPSPERAPTAQAQATAFIKAFQERSHGRRAGNRLYFAGQIPQLAKSQVERLTLPKEE